MSRTLIDPSARLQPQTEKAIMLTIRAWLSYRGFATVRIPPSVYSDRGMPDLWFGRGPVQGWIEVKSAKGKQSPAQRAFQIKMLSAGCIYILARSVEDVERVIG